MRNLKKVLSLALALVMLLGMMVVAAGAEDYSDQADIDKDEAVAVLSAIGVLNGSNGAFNPEKAVKRSEAAAIITRLTGRESTAKALEGQDTGYADVPASHWASGYINYCKTTKIMEGSGGAFRPNGDVKGTEFAKMLLVALGYNPETENLVGANWNVYTTALAMDNDFLNNLDELAGLNSPLTRQQVAQMAFTALTCDMVRYDKDTGDREVRAAKTSGTNNVSYTGSVATAGATGEKATLQFCEQYFPKLGLAETGTPDAFGRPTSEWTLSDQTDPIFAASSASPLKVYTEEVDTVEDDLKGYEVDMDKADHWTNGKAEGTSGKSTITTLAGIEALTKDGTVVEIYGANRKVTKVVVIETKAATVTSVNEARKTFTIRYDTDKSLTIRETSKVGAELIGTVAKDDVLAVVFDVDSKVVSLAPAASETGTVTRVKGTGNVEATVGGTDYTVTDSTKSAVNFGGKLGKDVIVYLDVNGYVIHIADAEAAEEEAAKYIFVTNMWQEKTSQYGKETKTNYVMGVNAAGEAVTLEVMNDMSDTDVSSVPSADQTKYFGTAGANDVYGYDAGKLVEVKDDTGLKYLSASNDWSKSALNRVYAYSTTKVDDVYALRIPAAGTASAVGVKEVANDNSNKAGLTLTATKTHSSNAGGITVAADAKMVYVTGNGDKLEGTLTERRAIAEGDSTAANPYTIIVEEVGGRKLATVFFINTADPGAASEGRVVYVTGEDGQVKYNDKDGKSQTGWAVNFYEGTDEKKTETMKKAAPFGSSVTAGYYELTEDGEGFTAAQISSDVKVKRLITAMYNGTMTVDGVEVYVGDAEVIDLRKDGTIGSVEDLESAANSTEEKIEVSVAYKANASNGGRNEAEVVYVTGAKSSVTDISKVTLKLGSADAVEVTTYTTEDAAKAAPVNGGAGNATVVVTVTTVDNGAEATWTFKADGQSTFTASSDSTKTTTQTTAAKTDVIKITVTAADESTADCYIAITMAANGD